MPNITKGQWRDIVTRRDTNTLRRQIRASDNNDLQGLVKILSEDIDACKELLSISKDWVNTTTYYNGLTPLYAASYGGHAEVCKILITLGNANVNEALQNGLTPLYAASYGGHVEACRILITVGNANVNKALQNGLTPLYAASYGGHVEVCRILITVGNANVNKALIQDGFTPLYAASDGGHVDVCRFLVTECNADVNKASDGGFTPLYAASGGGHVDVCRFLVTECNAEVNKFSDVGFTPIYAASDGGHVHVCRFLITECNADVNKASNTGFTPLYTASLSGHIDVCRLLITKGNADVYKASEGGYTPLYAASKGGHVDVCRFLLSECNADVNKASDDGFTPLYAASAGGHVDVCRFLVTKCNAEVNKASDDGFTPLFASSDSGHVDVCRFFVTECNADVNKASDSGITPLIAAIRANHVDVCKFLITEGYADVNKASGSDITPLIAAIRANHVDVCKFLITEGNADVNKASGSGSTPLCAAVEHGNIELCRLLITEGKADVNKRSESGSTPLCAAVEHGNIELCRLLITEGKSDVNKPSEDEHRMTPLHEAARSRQIRLCQMLLETQTVDPSPVDRTGKTPLDYWPIQEQTDERQLLKKYTKTAERAAQRSALMRSGGNPVRIIKLFLVGDPAKGKSTLRTSLSSGIVELFRPNLRQADHIPTPGINVKEKKVRGAGSFMIWDTAGQAEFHVTHAMLLGTSRGIFFAVYSCCDSFEEQTKQLSYWVCFIHTCHDPAEKTKPVIQLVGTHIDLFKDKETAKTLFHKHVQNLKTIFRDHVYISEEVVLLDSRRARSQGLAHLKKALNVLAEPLRCELTPKICDEITKRIAGWCNKKVPLLYFKDFTEKVRSEIDKRVTDETLLLAVNYLHNMGEIHHAKLRDRDAIIFVHPNWLTTTIFAPIFAPPNFRADYSGLPLNQDYTVDDLRCYFKLDNLDLLVDLLEYFELAYRNDDGTFIIPAKLPADTPDVVWSDDSMRYFGRRIACRHECDMFSNDVFPCLQVSMMNRYRQQNVKPLLSRAGVKILGDVEGMAQQTQDKRAIHIAVRVTSDNEIKKGRDQLQEMESLVFDQIDERSRGTSVSAFFLSPRDLKTSTNLEDGVSFYSESALQEAVEKQVDLGHPVTLTRESTFDVNPSHEQAADSPSKDNYAKVCEAVHVFSYLSLPTVQASIEVWHQRQQQIIRPCLNSIHCVPHKKPSTKKGACQPCVDWGKAVESACFPVGKGVEWRNVTVSLFHKDPVEVTKAFLFKIPPGQTLTKFGDFDVGGVLKLMMGFRAYHNGDKACYDKMGKVLGIRNSLSHKKLEDNMAIAEKELDESFDAIEDVVSSLKTHQPTLKDDEIKSTLKQIRQSHVTPAMMDRATSDLTYSLRQALDEWLDKNKKRIAEAVWEDPHPRKLERDISEIKRAIGDVKEDIGDVKGDIGDVRRDIADVKENIGGIEEGNGKLLAENYAKVCEFGAYPTETVKDATEMRGDTEDEKGNIAIAKTTTDGQSMISDPEILEAAKLISLPDMEKLCGHLQLPKVKIQVAKLSVEKGDIIGQNKAMLQAWRRKTGNDATTQKLLEALERLGNREACDKLQAKWKCRP